MIAGPLSATSGALTAASAAAALIYGFGFRPRPVSAPRTVVKTIAVGALAVMAWLSGHIWLLAIGLSLSALGDAVSSTAMKSRVIAAMACFLLAQAAYVVVFLHAGAGLGMIRAQPIRFAGVLAATAGAVVAFRLAAPALGPLAGPVGVYTLAVLAMTFTAFALPWTRWPAMAGAVAFAISDGILAVRRFRYEGRPNAAADLAVWWLHYGAQAGIAAAFLLSRA